MSYDDETHDGMCVSCGFRRGLEQVPGEGLMCIPCARTEGHEQGTDEKPPWWPSDEPEAEADDDDDDAPAEEAA